MRRTRQGALMVALVVFAASAAVAQPRSPRSDAEATLAKVQAKKEGAAVAAEPIAKARRALERAERVRQAGDRERAPLLERAARQWAELARDLIRAVEAERQADGAEKRLADIETRTVRARALLEETIARRGRARAELEALEAEAKKPAEPTSAPGSKKSSAPVSAPAPKKPAEPRP